MRSQLSVQNTRSIVFTVPKVKGNMTTCGPNLVRDECFLAGPAIQSQEVSPPWFININPSASASVSIVPLRPWDLAILRD